TFSKFDKFIAMAVNENYDFESDEEEPKFEKITVGIKDFIMTLELLLLRLLLSLTKVNAASSRVTTADKVTTAGWIKTEIAYRSRLLTR
nr:hypothetical protein [Tanacetum cinerariifolium]